MARANNQPLPALLHAPDVRARPLVKSLSNGQAAHRAALWNATHPWWLAALLAGVLTLMQPGPLGVIPRLDQRAFELLSGLAHGSVEAASLAAGLLLAVLPLALMGWLAARFPMALNGRWLLALALTPYGLAALGLALARHWLPPTSAAMGWVVGWALWRARHLRDTRAALQQARGQADATLRAITDAVFTVDAAHHVHLMNPVAASLAAPANSTPRSHRHDDRLITELLSLTEQDSHRLHGAITTCLLEQRVIHVAQPLTLSSGAADSTPPWAPTTVPPLRGRERWGARRRPHQRLLRVTASPVFDGGKAAQRAVVVLSDVTESVLASARLQHDASHDPLTGLPNRISLDESFTQAMLRARRAGRHLALLFIDLDRFKRINDSLGHHHGDTVLKQVARRLRERMRSEAPEATMVRWGGDEFVVLVEDDGDGTQAQALAYQLMNAVSHSIELDELDVHCSCSIGLALAPLQASTLDALLTLADLGMRRAKLHGGGRMEFSASHAATATGAPPWTRDVLNLETRLRHALDNDELELHYQPQLDVVRGEPVGLEALLRWRQADGVVWSPGQFLDVAEESGLILDIGAWAIREATRQLGRWRLAGLMLLPVSINVSARQCLDRRLVQIVSAALAAEGIPASLLKLEITETTAMTDVEQVMLLLAELRALGVGVAVDDFGTGYSSLAHLQRLPIDQIKIDQSFVRDIANDRHGAAIVRATIALAHELGVPVVAEGVEHESQLRFLTLHHCDIAQGYYFARPLNHEATSAYLHAARRPADNDGQPVLTFG